jgi:glycyl-tRNA synthetase beta chain
VTEMQAADFLVELGTEELPPKALLRLRDAFRDGVVAGLLEARLNHGAVLAYATPRRLSVLVNSLTLTQPVQEIESRGPPVRIAYDDDGNPTQAALAFAGKCGVPVEQLETVATGKGEWLYFKGSASGAAAKDLLGNIVANSLAALPIPKRMRWGSSDVEFVRPVHWLVMLLGTEIVTAEVLNLKSGRTTYGHRFLAPAPIALKSPADYVEVLRTTGRVIVDCAERQALIEAMARQTAIDAGGTAVLQADVVEEVTALVELPVPVAGSFDAVFLRLPPEVLISTLQDHQRYFPVQGTDGLLPAFVTISNLESTDPDQVRRGNERVVLPRLADAAFFWDQDSAVPLSSRVENLKNVVYQKGLGSLHDKSQRVGELAALVAGYLQADIETVERAATLARTDLLTAMVGEFPELQGRMGYYYARNDGESEAVAVAIEEQYLPRHAGDRLPATPIGMALSLADRLDTLAGIFALGKKPSGNKDPFGLRRQALGLIRILIECRIDVDLPALLVAAVELQPLENPVSPTVTELNEFILERLRSWYITGQAPGFAKGDITPEMFESVRSRAPASPLDFQERLVAVYRFMSLDAASALAAANKRIANILKKADQHTDKSSDNPVSAALFDADEEQELYKAVVAVLPGHKTDLAARNYADVLLRLAELRGPVDGYFDQVMVMTDDAKQRANRLAQLSQLRELFLDVADISCIPTSR